jgi:hypothetical protein
MGIDTLGSSGRVKRMVEALSFSKIQVNILMGIGRMMSFSKISPFDGDLKYSYLIFYSSYPPFMNNC